MLFKKKSFMMVLIILVVGALFIISTAALAAKSEAEYNEWLKEAELGEYMPAEEDWDLILEKAKNEPPLTIYSGTSRVIPVAEDLNEKYDLEIEVLNIRATEIVERVRREYNAGLYSADVVLSGGADAIYDQLLLNNAVTRYVPVEVEKATDKQHTNPIMVHRYSVGTWYYNMEKDGGAPYENIWELTTDKWRNRIAMQSPLDSGTTMDYVVGIVHNADKMETMYEEFFGEEIELTTPNAGYEFLKRLLDNDVRILDSFRDVVEAVSRADDYFVGFGTQSLYRDVVEGIYDFKLDTEINPAVVSPRVISIGSYTESPNKAKFLINHLLSQAGGEPWWGGDFPSTPLVKSVGAMSDLSLDSFDKLWNTPLDKQIVLRDDVADFFILYE